MISVIISIHNAEDCLPICLNSVLNQSYQNFEVICIDNASTDSSLNILYDFAKKDSRIFIYKNNSYEGIGFCRNKGLNIANGEYIFFLDALDWIFEDTFQELIQKIKKENSDLVIFKSIILNHEYSIFCTDSYYDVNYLKDFDSRVFNHKIINKKNLFDIANIPYNKLYLKSFLDENSIYFSNDDLSCEDISFFYKVFTSAKRISFLDTYLYNHRIKIKSDKFNRKYLKDNIKISFQILDVFFNNESLYDYYKKEVLTFIFASIFNHLYIVFDNQTFFDEMDDVFKNLINNYNIYEDVIENVDSDILNILQFEEVAQSLMEHVPKISVIVPVFNVEKYLPECLYSVISQSFKDFELICVNDGSTDQSLEILKKYAQLDSRIDIISKENGGLSSARNAGLRKAKGKYVYFLDSDDYLNPNALKEIYEISEKNDLDVLMFKLQCFHEETKEKFTTAYFEMDYLQHLVGENVFNYKDVGDRLFDLCVTTESNFFKNDLISDMSFYKGLIFEDNVFFAEALFKAKRVFFYNKYLCNYRFRENSITSSNFGKFSDIIEISNLLIDLTKKYADFNRYAEVLYSRKLLRIKIRFSQVPEEYKQDFFDKIKKDFLEKKDKYEFDESFQRVPHNLKNIFYAALNSLNYKEFERKL